jgi:hypothetical protein
MRARARLLALLGALLATAPAAAQRPWNQLTPDEQRRAWENYQRYRALPEERREFMQRRWEQFRELPPDERNRVRENYQRYRELPPGERREFGEKYRRWKERDR